MFASDKKAALSIPCTASACYDHIGKQRSNSSNLGCPVLGQLDIWQLDIRQLDIRQLDIRQLEFQQLDIRQLELWQLDIRQ